MIGSLVFSLREAIVLLVADVAGIFGLFNLAHFLRTGEGMPPRSLSLVWIAAVFLFLLFGVEPAVPHSLVKLYGLVTVIAVLLYATSSEQGRTALWGPIRAVMTEARLVESLPVGEIRFGVATKLLIVEPGRFRAIAASAP